MHDKTQVFPLSDDDNIHTRLTHSQEVMSIGYTFGIKLINEIYNDANTNINEDEFKFLENKDENLRATLLRTIPIILQSVCLFHDIGNTPFGHFGEDTISNYFAELFENSYLDNSSQKIDFTQYDGNAQGLRVLTKLQILDNLYGLNLTSAVLGTYIKYPNKSDKNSDEIKKTDKAIISNNKHGVFFSEYDYFEKIMENCGLKHDEKYFRHPLCYLMEAADTIAYRTMDVEDGFNKKIYNAQYIIKVLTDINQEDKDDEFKSSYEEFTEKINNINEKYADEKTKMVRLRIFLIEYMVNKAFSIFTNNYNNIMNGEYQRELLDDDELKIEDRLGDICKKKIYDCNEVNSLEVTGYSVIKGLLDFYIKALIDKKNGLERKAYNLISKSIINTAIFENKVILNQLNGDETDISNFCFDDFEKLDSYYRFRIIVDYISGMTDKYALMHYQKISGQRI
jgi:dGTPase